MGRFGYGGRASFSSSSFDDSGISKTQAAQLYSVSKSDVETLTPIGCRRGQYGVYDVYSLAQISNLAAKVAVQKQRLAAQKEANAKALATQKQLEKDHKKAAKQAKTEEAEANKRRKKEGVETAKREKILIKQFGGLPALEAHRQYEAAVHIAASAHEKFTKLQADADAARQISEAAAASLVSATALIHKFPKAIAAAAANAAAAASSSASFVVVSNTPGSVSASASWAAQAAQLVLAPALASPVRVCISPAKKRTLTEAKNTDIVKHTNAEAEADTDFIDLVGDAPTSQSPVKVPNESQPATFSPMRDVFVQAADAASTAVAAVSSAALSVASTVLQVPVAKAKKAGRPAKAKPVAVVPVPEPVVTAAVAPKSTKAKKPKAAAPVPEPAPVSVRSGRVRVQSSKIRDDDMSLPAAVRYDM